MDHFILNLLITIFIENSDNNLKIFRLRFFDTIYLQSQFSG